MKSAAFDEERPELLLDVVAALSDEYPAGGIIPAIIRI